MRRTGVHGRGAFGLFEALAHAIAFVLFASAIHRPLFAWYYTYHYSSRVFVLEGVLRRRGRIRLRC
eukprot:15353130-Alexandrium_andersonii.AAC.1